MIWKKYSELDGQHAFLGASKYSWLNYDRAKLIDTYKRMMATKRGTRLHAYAEESIKLGQKLPRTNKTLNRYVNDAIGYRMRPEQKLYYSKNAFGTADSISFRRNLLRIHDLKTGETPAHMEQLEIYAALFCLDYDVDPHDIGMELRLYQNDEILYLEPTAEDIESIMAQIEEFDECIEQIKAEEEML